MKGLFAANRDAALLVGATLCLVTAAGSTVFGQRGGARPTSVERRIEQLNRQSEQYERDKLSRDLKGAADRPGDRRRSQAVLDQVRHDLEGLQAGYNRMVLAMASRQGLDHDSILDAVAEVKKCAVRLKDNLALPKPEDDAAQGRREEASPESTEESLLSLRKHIYSFVTNPIFDGPAVLDVEQAGKASRDLERIIHLSENLKRGGGKVGKPAGP